jgi:hypothetical protein
MLVVFSWPSLDECMAVGSAVMRGEQEEKNFSYYIKWLRQFR